MAKLILNGSTSGSISLESPAVSGTTTLTLPATTGTVLITNGSGIASVNGVQFPATQSASADANCLDDYEEGTWTPRLTFNGGTTGITYSNQIGSYVKIGSMVTVWVYIVLTSKGSSSGIAYIDNFPFSPVTYFSTPSINFGNITYTGMLAPYMDTGGQLYMQQTTEAGSQTNLSNSNFANNSALFLTWSYRT